MNKHVEKLKKLAAEKGLTVMERPNDIILVIGGEKIVQWWPASKRMTAYVERGDKGVRFATPEKVIELATGGV